MATILIVSSKVSGDHIDMLTLVQEQLSRGRWLVRANPDACDVCKKNASNKIDPQMPELHKHCHCQKFWHEDDNPDEDL